MVLAWLTATGALLDSARAATGILDVDDKVNGIDISQAREPLVSERPEINVQGPDEKDKTKLVAQGPGPSYYWSLFSLNNVTDQPLDFVLAIDAQYYPGSGVFKLVPAGPAAISAVSTKDGQSLQISDTGQAQAIHVHIPPNGSTNLALETFAPNFTASLWQSASFQSQESGNVYFIGVAEGIMLLVAVALLGLYAYRAQRAALAAAFFALACLIFVDVGANSFIGKIYPMGTEANIIRSSVESLMLVALAFLTSAFLSPQLLHGWLTRIMVGIGVLGLAIFGYGLAEPLAASSLARGSFFALALFAAVTGWRSREQDREVVDSAGIFWVSLLIWMFVTVVLALDQSHAITRSTQLAAITAALMIVLAVVMLRHTANQGLSSRPFIRDASLRSLALSAGRHIMWDWDPYQQKLEISGELERLLDLPIEAVTGNRLQQFYAALHPLDMETYRKLAERIDYMPGERLQLELRLQHGDGSYHWYDLQARAVPGPENTVDRCIGTLTNIGKLKTVEERLTNDALQDGVSGLPNKGLFVDRVDRSLGILGALPLRVVIIDIDRFKTINEGLGQDVGDRILKIAAERLADVLDETETVARMNGAQFALECAETIDRGDMTGFVTTLQDALATPIQLGAQHIVLSASIGVSDSGRSGDKAQDLIDQATIAMLEARAEGGARAEYYHTELKDDRAEQLSLESDLRLALTRNEIEIYYQPIVALASLDVIGFEALARWRHPQLGLLQPLDFMEIAETAGLMPDIGQHMLAGAARQLGIWQRVHMRGRPFFVSVNASASQLAIASFPAKVEQILKRENLVPGSLKIEITETVVMRQPERGARLLTQLKAMGVGLACDDFGTGFSSLSSLRDFPFDTLKLDRSFIAAEDFDERNGKIVNSITTLAMGLGMAVIAEGIETQDQINRLAAMGCAFGQGYLIGAPETAEAASGRLTQMLLGSSSDNHHVPISFSSPNKPSRPISIPDPLPPVSMYTPPPTLAPLPPSGTPRSLLQPMFVEELPSIFSMPSTHEEDKPKRRKVKRKPVKKKKR